jgi:CO dehydrogenase/acetyl-CoA synthase alpha subunit
MLEVGYQIVDRSKDVIRVVGNRPTPTSIIAADQHEQIGAAMNGIRGFHF